MSLFLYLQYALSFIKSQWCCNWIIFLLFVGCLFTSFDCQTLVFLLGMRDIFFYVLFSCNLFWRRIGVENGNGCHKNLFFLRSIGFGALNSYKNLTNYYFASISVLRCFNFNLYFCNIFLGKECMFVFMDTWNPFRIKGP